MGGIERILDPEQDCRSARGVYCVNCLTCLDQNHPIKVKYLGTTGRISQSRLLQHKRAVRTNANHNALAKHQRHKHQGQEQRFKAKIERSGLRFNSDRFIHEALVIQDANEDTNVLLMNQKG